MAEMDDKDAILDVDNAFSNGDRTVINWEGENYYKACGEPVVANSDGSGSSCVKRQDHPGDIHEDYDGVRRSEKSGKMLMIVSFDEPTTSREDYDRTAGVMQAIKPFFAKDTDVKVSLSIRETADELLMILKGDG